jgi:SAM-dependent methyltransferase
MDRRRVWAVVLLACTAMFAQAAEPKQAQPPGNIAPYYPTPYPIVFQMLKLAKLEPGELHYDLGSGDGRLVLIAARDFKARSVGYELDPALVASSRRQIKELGLADNASIVEADLFTADFTKPDLITVYLLPRALTMLRPLLEKQMKPGSRVVSHDFAVPGWEPSETVTSEEEADIDGLYHTIYLYQR